MPKLSFKTTLEPRGPAAAVVLSDDQVQQVGEGAKAFPVKATVNGYTWGARVARMGGENLLGMSKAIRSAAKVEAGDKVDVVIELDTKPREIAVPAELAQALKKAKKQKAFDALAPSKRKEFARQVTEAKKPETRDNRIAKIVESI